MLSDADIDELIQRAMAGGSSLDELVTRAIFHDARIPALWGDWPRDARETWDRAMRRHAEVTSWLQPVESHHRAHVDVAEAWRVLSSFAPDPADWASVPGLTWAMVAPALRLPVRAVHYQLCDLQGWRLRGRGAQRRIVQAPCIVCSRPRPAAEIVERTCEACRDADGTNRNMHFTHTEAGF